MPQHPSPHGHTVLSTFRTCPQKAYLNFHHRGSGIEGTEVAEKFAIGGIMHKIVAEHYLGKNYDECYAAGMGEALKRYSVKTEEEVPEKIRQMAHRLFTGYREAYPNESWRVYEDAEGPFVERTFVVSLSGVLYSITIDLLIEEAGVLCVMDHKFTGLPLGQFFPQFFLDFQTTGYCWVMQNILNKPVNTVIINACWKGSGKLPISQYQREQFTRDQIEVSSFVRETLHWQSVMNMATSSGFWPRNTDACVGPWGTCGFHPWCVTRGGIEDKIFRVREGGDDAAE